jgi:threonine synthase
MDILVSSNLERLLYEYADRDPVVVRGWMQQLKDSGSFSIGAQRLAEIRKIFWADYADDNMTAESIRRVYDRCQYVMDPHTAVGSHALRNYRLQTGDSAPAVILATASPYKFSEDVLSSLLGKEAVEGMDAFACAAKLEEISGVPMPKQVAQLSQLPIRHTAVCEVEEMEQAVLAELNK